MPGALPCADSGCRCLLPANGEVAFRLNDVAQRLRAVMGDLRGLRGRRGKTLDEEVRLLQILVIYTFVGTHCEG